MAHEYAGIPANSKIKAAAEVRSYKQAKDFLAGESVKIIASNVQVVRIHRTCIGIKLYQTVILKYHADGTFEASNGGFNTLTTTTRLNQFGPANRTFNHHRKKLCFGFTTPVEERKRYKV